MLHFLRGLKAVFLLVPMIYHEIVRGISGGAGGCIKEAVYIYDCVVCRLSSF